MKKIYLDSNYYIYLIEKRTKYLEVCKSLLNRIEKKGDIVIASPLILFELIRKTNTQSQNEILKLAFRNFPNLSIANVSIDVVTKMLTIRGTYKLELPDLIHVSTAILAECDEFITNDKVLKKIKGIKITYLDDLLKTKKL